MSKCTHFCGGRVAGRGSERSSAGHGANLPSQELTSAEAAEFFVVYGRLEVALERALGADLVNVWCLRNFAFRRDDPDPPLLDGRPNPHVHWHVAPRFSSPIEIAGEQFVDGDFGWPLVWRERRMAPDGRRAVIAMLREAMDVAYA